MILGVIRTPRSVGNMASRSVARPGDANGEARSTSIPHSWWAQGTQAGNVRPSQRAPTPLAAGAKGQDPPRSAASGPSRTSVPDESRPLSISEVFRIGPSAPCLWDTAPDPRHRGDGQRRRRTSGKPSRRGHDGLGLLTPRSRADAGLPDGNTRQHADSHRYGTPVVGWVLDYYDAWHAMATAPLATGFAPFGYG